MLWAVGNLETAELLISDFIIQTLIDHFSGELIEFVDMMSKVL